MPSMTRRSLPLPKVRVTLRRWSPGRPHEAQARSDKVDRDDVERAGRAEFDDRFGLVAGERAPADDALDLAGLAVPLSLDKFAREDNAFEIEDRDVVIFKFFSSVNGYDIVQGTNEVADPCNSWLWHTRILRDTCLAAQRNAHQRPGKSGAKRRCSTLRCMHGLGVYPLYSLV
jgi:hypothetical protein